MQTLTKVILPDREVTLRCRYWANPNSRKTPVVFIHGWPQSSATWDAVVARLPADRDCYAPDLRGLGDSQRYGVTSDFQKHQLAADVEAVLNFIGLEKLVLVGHDWGGIVAQELALDDRKRFAGLALLNINLINNPVGNAAGRKAHISEAPDPRWFITYQAIPGLAERMIPGNEDAWIRYFMSHTAPANTIPEELIEEYIRCYSIAGTARCGAEYYRSLRDDYRRWATLAGYRQTLPTLILHGTYDPLITTDFFRGHEACFEQVTLKKVPAGHFAQDECPEQVADELERFFATLD